MTSPLHQDAPPRGAQVWAGLAVSFCALGFSSLVAQTLFLREFLAISFGNELTLGIALSFWLGGISAGALASGRAVGRHGAGRAFVLTLAVLSVAGFAELSLIRAARLILAVSPGQIASLGKTAVAAAFGVAPFGLLVGWAFPIASQLARQALGTQTGRSIAGVYVAESLGGLAGGLALTFFFIPCLTPSQILFASSIVLSSGCLLSCRLLRLDARLTRLSCAVSLLFLLGAVTPLPGWFESASGKLRWRGINPALEHRASVDTRFQHIDIGSIEEQFSVYSNGQLVAAFPDPYAAQPMAHLIMAAQPHWRRPAILLVGGGSLGLLAFITGYDTGRIDIVEMDGALINAMKQFLDGPGRASLDDARVRLFSEDARSFISRTTDRYDLIVLFLPEPSNAMLNRYYTVEFFARCRSSLKQGGMLALNAGAGMNYLGGETLAYTASVYRTLSTVFAHVAAVPLDSVQFFAGSTGQISLDLPTLQQRHRERWRSGGSFTAEHLSALIEPDRIQFLKRELDEAPDVPRNRDARPATYFFNLVLWEKMSGGLIGPVLQQIRELGWIVPSAGLAALALFTASVGWRMSRSASPGAANPGLLLAIATTGLCGMSWDLVLLYAFQSAFGYLYHWVGLLVALFMLGLALGGLAGQALLRVRRVTRALVFADGSIALFCLFLALFLHQQESGFADGLSPIVSRSIFVALVIAAGILIGLPFPLVAGLMRVSGEETGAVAGAVDAADHGGAILGAGLTGVMLVPLCGMVSTLCILFGVKLCSLTLLVFMKPAESPGRFRDGAV